MKLADCLSNTNEGIVNQRPSLKAIEGAELAG